MSILIKGATKQQVMKVLINSTEWLPDDIEVIEIPTPHGRLIDADALNLDYEVNMADDWKTAHEIANCVRYAPTAIEAEEQEHE